MNPLVSIITVVFNGVNTIEQTILSVLNQSYKNIEYIIIDGNSTDGTMDIIKKYEEKIAKYVSETDKGLYDAMNKGISIANGEIIGMVNSDDWYEVHAVEKIIKFYIENPDKKIFHADIYEVNYNGDQKLRKFNKSKFKFFYYAMTFNHPSMFIHKDVYKTDKYNIDLKSLSDYEFVLNQYRKNPDLFFYIESAFVNYRTYGISASRSLMQGIKEGVIVRRNVKMSFIEIFFSSFVGILIYLIFKKKNEKNYN